jgi:creatinine amidohydrolase
MSIRFALASLVLWLCWGVAQAQAGDTVFLDELTWTELRDQVAGGRTTILVPIGGTEQNGPAMVLGKHNVRVRLLSERIAQGLGNALVAPVMAYVAEGSIDPPTAHMRFPGTITVPDLVFQKVIESAARSFRHHGFRDIVLIGEHGDYQKSLQAVANRLNREWAAGPAKVHALARYYGAIERDFPQLLRQRGYRDGEIGIHAGLADTSLSLALDPKLVRMPQITQAPPPGRGDGVSGDPRRASAELGQIGADLIVARSVEAIRRATQR